MNDRPMRFHWSLSQAGDRFRASRAKDEMTGLLDAGAQLELCRRAEQSGIDSMLMAIGFTRPDPMILATVLGAETDRISFMVACRSGLLSPTLFVQQINTLSTLVGGRVHINIVAGHSPHEQRYYGDHLEHDARYDRADEFLAVCHALWKGDGPVDFTGDYYRVEGGRINTPFLSPEGRPEIFIGGNSDRAADLTARHGDCLWRFADAPSALAPVAGRLVSAGKEVGLLCGIIARPTRGEAVDAACAMVRGFGSESTKVHRDFLGRSDSVAYRSTYETASRQGFDWLTPVLWSGAVPFLGPIAMALVGSYDEIAAELVEYRRAGVTQFLFIGWPDIEEVERFGGEVLPRLRALEHGLDRALDRALEPAATEHASTPHAEAGLAGAPESAGVGSVL